LSLRKLGSLRTELCRSEWSASRSGNFNPGKRAESSLWLWGWVGPTAGLDA